MDEGTKKVIGKGNEKSHDKQWKKALQGKKVVKGNCNRVPNWFTHLDCLLPSIPATSPESVDDFKLFWELPVL